MKEYFSIETATYAVTNSIDKEPGFAWWVPHVLQKLDRFIKKVNSKYCERAHKYGIRIPKTITEVLQIDEENGNILWRDTIDMEMKNDWVAFEEYNGEISSLIGYEQITGHILLMSSLGRFPNRKQDMWQMVTWQKHQQHYIQYCGGKGQYTNTNYDYST